MPTPLPVVVRSNNFTELESDESIKSNDFAESPKKGIENQVIASSKHLEDDEEFYIDQDTEEIVQLQSTIPETRKQIESSSKDSYIEMSPIILEINKKL